MGRYYTGDIQGKFWVGVQRSTDASFFGGQETEPNYLNYYFSQDDLPAIESGIQTCLEKLGDTKRKLDQFFEKHPGYSDEMLVQAGFAKNRVPFLLEWYARLTLGQKILSCVTKQGNCSFEAEF